MTVITSRTEAEYEENLAKLNEKHGAVYPQIINYINQKVLTPHKKKLVRCGLIYTFIEIIISLLVQKNFTEYSKPS
jgi:uncharacterized protein YqhQ